MNKNIASLIIEWHGVYVSLTECVEDARVVLDQSDRGTLLPDRVREMRRQLIHVQHSIPHLADLMEELIGVTVWPMKVETTLDIAAHEAHKAETEEAAEITPAKDTEPPATAEGDYDAGGSTPDADPMMDEEAAAEIVDTEPDEPGGVDAKIDE